MVLSKILVLLKTAQQQNNSTSTKNNHKQLRIKSVVGIHIDYANRPESDRECEYVRQWCADIGVEFRARVINEVTRGARLIIPSNKILFTHLYLQLSSGITSRDEYEKVAREIRYSFYVECLEQQPGSSTAGVMFGHHMGDVQENVISNVMRGVSPLDLSGMTESSVSNGVTVWRPLLSHNKDEIYEFAHK